MITYQIGLPSLILPLLNGTEYEIVSHNLEKVLKRSDAVFEYFTIMNKFVSNKTVQCTLYALFFKLLFTIYFFHLLFIYKFFIGSLFRFPCYLQAPLFDFHVVYRLPFSIYMSFAGSLFRFPCYLQAPFFDLNEIYRLPFSIYMLFTGSLF